MNIYKLLYRRQVIHIMKQEIFDYLCIYLISFGVVVPIYESFVITFIVSIVTHTTGCTAVACSTVSVFVAELRLVGQRTVATADKLIVIGHIATTAATAWTIG